MQDGGSTAGRDYIVRRNAAKGRKKFLTCLQYMRTPGVPATSQEFPKWQSRHHLPSLSPSSPYFALLSNLLSSFQAPLHPRSLPHSRCHCGCCYCCCCTLFTPFAGARALLSFDGESERSHVPWRATASFNWDAITSMRMHTRLYCMSTCVRARIAEYFTSLKTRYIEIRDVCYP